MKLVLMNKFLVISVLAFVCPSHLFASTHKACVNNICADVQGEGHDQCYENSDCDTECSKDGQGQGSIYSGTSCGLCTSGSCGGQDVGKDCEMNVGGTGTTVKGVCESKGICSHVDPGGHTYSGACGISCLCVKKKKKTTIAKNLEDLDVLLEGILD